MFFDSTTAFRVFHGAADGLPHITVDLFSKVAVVSLYVPFTEAQEHTLVKALVHVLAPHAVYLKRRPLEARNSVKMPENVVSPKEPVWGTPVSECVVTENGIQFLIRPSNGLSVGLYLDARDVRAWVKANTAMKTVLNCFAYTCGFGLAAQSGGARRAVNIDVSRRVLDWGMENAALNGQPANQRDYIAGDVFDWLGRFRKKGERFDMVIVDPPSFSTTQESRFSAERDYGRLVELAASVVAENGTLVACCNLSTLNVARFRTWVLQGCSSAGRQSLGTTEMGASQMDFPVTPQQESALKVMSVSLK